MKKLQTTGFAGAAAAALLGLAGMTSTANAQLISITSGNFTIFADGYSVSNTSPDSSTAASSAPGSTLVTQNPGDPAPPAGTKEDTYGIFQITSITQGTSPSTPVFTDNLGTEYWGIFYNSYDVASGLTPMGNVEFAARGLKLDIYKVLINDTNDNAWTNVYTTTGFGAERIGQSGYQGISNAGTLVLSSSLNGVMGASFNTSQQTTNATGSLNVSLNNLFSGPGNLAPLSFSLGGDTKTPPLGWSVEFGGPINGAFVTVPVPEPSTYSLMGVCALAGVIAVRRWKKRAQNV